MRNDNTDVVISHNGQSGKTVINLEMIDMIDLNNDEPNTDQSDWRHFSSVGVETTGSVF